MSLEDKQLILTKIESSYGVDPTPAAATEAILTGKVTIEIIEKAVERKVVLPYFGSLKNINIGEGVKISFPVEVRGSGTAATPPRIGPLLRAANLSQTIATTVDYDPNSSQDGESCAIYFYGDGLLWKVLGCMTESIKLTAKANEVATWEFSLIGLWGGAASITDAAYAAPTHEGAAVVPPVFKSASFTIDSYAAIIENFEVTLKNKVVKRPSANAASGVLRYSIIGREVTGSVDPEWVTKATYDPWTTWEGSTSGAITATIGSTSGNKWVISVPNALKKAPKFGAREGIRTYTLEFIANPTLSAGNNEINYKHST